MARLLDRLKYGVAEGIQTLARTNYEDAMERKRMKRMAAIEAQKRRAKQEEQAFKTSEREATQEFEREMKRGRDKPLSVKKVEPNEDTGGHTIFYDDGSAKEYDPETDTYKNLGGGEPRASDELQAKASKYAEEKVDAMAGWLSSDATDFKDFSGSRALAKQAFIQEYIDASKQGKLGELYKGLSDDGAAKESVATTPDLVQEQAPLKQDQPTAPNQRPTSKQAPAQMTGSDIVDDIISKNVDADEDSILNQIANDERMPASAREDARKRLVRLRLSRAFNNQ